MSDPSKPSPKPQTTPAATVEASSLPFLQRMSRQSLTWAIGAAFETSAKIGNLLPLANPERYGVSVTRDIPYTDQQDTDHLLDIYRPLDAQEPLPVVLYIHGGGFRILSKDTHWLMAIEFARRGYVVCTVNYRLAPAHPFPAAAEDVCDAWRWMLDHVAAYGGDPDRAVVSGESAGANLCTVVAVVACIRRAEPWARAVFERGVVPKAVIPFCGILQVTDPRRFERMGLSSRLTQPVIDSCFANYMVGDPSIDVTGPSDASEHPELADPLCVIEQTVPDRAFPPFYIPCGTADPLIDDSRRLGAALRAQGGIALESEFEGQGHAFQAWLMKKSARLCWSEVHAFLDAHVGEPAAEAPAVHTSSQPS